MKNAVQDSHSKAARGELAVNHTKHPEQVLPVNQHIATKQTLHIQLLSYMIYLRTPERGKHWTKMWWIVRPPPLGLAPVHTVKSAQLHCIGVQNSSACYFQLYRMINVAFLSIAHSLHVSIKTCFYAEIARHDNSRWGSDC